MTTREQHLSVCKQNALSLVRAGDPRLGFVSIVTSVQNHRQTANHPRVKVGTQLMLQRGWLENADEMKRFIEGFD
jgi:hypothetical protein